MLVSIEAILISGCLEEITPPSVTGELNVTAEMLIYLEGKGDYANSNLAPPLITAQEVFDNLDKYLILDVRSQDEYLSGHIENSINITADSLYNYIADRHNSGYPKIVIASKNGHSSAYYATLLRLAGFINVYTLKYGMASWHINFAYEWMNAVGDYVHVDSFTNAGYPKNERTALPNPPIDNPNALIDEIVQGRIKKIINEGFNFTNSFSTLLFPPGNPYLICYGNSTLYTATKFGTLGTFGHPVGTVQYFDSPFFEFRSIHFLQTLPNNREILIYSYNGQLSASMTAYLKILGYKVKTYLFGANSLFYSRMITTDELMDFAFTSSNIMNFEYVIGNQ